MYSMQWSILCADLLYCHVSSRPVPCLSLCKSFLLFKWMSHSLSCLFPVFSSFRGRVAVASYNHNRDTLLIPEGEFACVSFFFKLNKCDAERLSVCFNCVWHCAAPHLSTMFYFYKILPCSCVFCFVFLRWFIYLLRTSSALTVGPRWRWQQ